MLDILLKDTGIAMMDGEHASESTKLAIDMSKTLFGVQNQSNNACGRKIDMIFSNCVKTKVVELSCNELKRANVIQDTILKQQCKNLRSNASVLQHTQFHCRINVEAIALDFVGAHGYLYLVKRPSYQAFIAKAIAPVFVPSHLVSLGSLKDFFDIFPVYS
ncbi:hypothetical protein MBANPS3_011491 [Mucor bainieri]